MDYTLPVTKWIKGLAWYTGVFVVISILCLIAAVGQPMQITPMITVISLILNAPIVALSILILVSHSGR